jgi:SAM-dependent methyltransferase
MSTVRSAKSYSSLQTTLANRARELWNLYLFHHNNVERRVSNVVDRARTAEVRIAERLGAPVAGQRLLDVGPGQQMPYLSYFAVQNDAVGVDLDLVAEQLTPRAYVAMFQQNGAVRVAKTLGRRALGLHKRYRAELAKQIGVAELGGYSLVQADGSRLGFRAGGFDVMFSNSVFEHLEHPEMVMRDTARVLRPGGVAYVSVYTWTSEAGCHDPRIFAGRREGLPLWSHLRERYAHLVRPNAYLNRWRIDEWRACFEREWPGVEIDVHLNEELRPELDRLRGSGELGAYRDEELLVTDLVAIWRKPDARSNVRQNSSAAQLS